MKDFYASRRRFLCALACLALLLAADWSFSPRNEAFYRRYGMLSFDSTAQSRIQVIRALVGDETSADRRQLPWELRTPNPLQASPELLDVGRSSARWIVEDVFRRADDASDTRAMALLMLVQIEGTGGYCRIYAELVRSPMYRSAENWWGTGETVRYTMFVRDLLFRLIDASVQPDEDEIKRSSRRNYALLAQRALSSRGFRIPRLPDWEERFLAAETEDRALEIARDWADRGCP